MSLSLGEEEKFYDESKGRPGTEAVEKQVEVVNAELDYDEAVSKKIVAKFDRVILPTIFFMYLFNALDRNNLGNAKTDHIDTDLRFVGNQYSQILSAFYAPFCGLCVPGALLTRRFGATNTMPIMMIGWSVFAICTAYAKDFAGVMGMRIALGVFEAGFAPSVIFYLSTFYTRGELGKRIAAFYCCSGVSGAFSGLLAYGLFQVNSYLKGWQILFILEGSVSLAVAFIAYLVLPPSPAKTKFLNEEQKKVAILRILKDSTTVIDGEFKYSDFFASLFDWKFYVLTAVAFSYGVGSGTASNFLPVIVARMGFSTVKTNLYTVAPNAVSVVVLLLVVWSSDYYRERSGHLCIAFIIFLPVSFTAGIMRVLEVNVSARAFRTGWFTFAANSAGLVSANIFRAKDAPQYTPALIITGSFEALAFVLVVSLRTWMMYENRKRNKAQGVNWSSRDVPTAILEQGYKNPKYRYFL